MTLRKPSGELDSKRIAALATAVAALITTGGGAIGGQVAAATQVAAMEVRIASLEASRKDTEDRLRSMEATINRTDTGVSMLLAAHKLSEVHQ